MRPSGRKASDQGCARAPATVSIVMLPAELWNVGSAALATPAASKAVNVRIGRMQSPSMPQLCDIAASSERVASAVGLFVAMRVRQRQDRQPAHADEQQAQQKRDREQPAL